MRIVHIADEKPEKTKKLTAKQKLHAEAIASLAERRIHDRIRAKEMFAKEHAEIKELEQKLQQLQQKLASI